MMVRVKNLSTPYIILQNESGDREYTIGQSWIKIKDDDVEYFKRCYDIVLEFKSEDSGTTEKTEKVVSDTVSKKKR